MVTPLSEVKGYKARPQDEPLESPEVRKEAVPVDQPLLDPDNPADLRVPIPLGNTRAEGAKPLDLEVQEVETRIEDNASQLTPSTPDPIDIPYVSVLSSLVDEERSVVMDETPVSLEEAVEATGGAYTPVLSRISFDPSSIPEDVKARANEPAVQTGKQTKVLEETDPSKAVDTGVLSLKEQRLRDAIAIGEGTADGGGYDRLLGHAENKLGVKITDMTVDQLIAMSRPKGVYGRHAKNQLGYLATPMGKYQIVGTTLRDLKKKMALSGDEKFSPALQDQMFKRLVNGRTDIKSLAQTWEGLQKNRRSRKAAIEALSS